MRAFCLALLYTAAFGVTAAAVSRQEGDVVAVSGAVDAPCVVLTFDDGPRRDTTSALLDGLAQRGVPATFFLVGLSVEGNEDLVLRMDAEGHQVGIHSQNHKVLTDLWGDALYWEMDELRHTLAGLLGRTDFMVRPPYGLTDAAVCHAADAPVILWSVDPEDWSDENTDRQVEHIVTRVKDGDIILLHDIYPSSVETALRVVDLLLERGFCFVTVEEMFALRGITPEKGKIYRSFPS
jgi:peptidoglycan/xylan/chitin deacetylase (PgdA/CDA1 family)